MGLVALLTANPVPPVLTQINHCRMADNRRVKVSATQNFQAKFVAGIKVDLSVEISVPVKFHDHQRWLTGSAWGPRVAGCGGVSDLHIWFILAHWLVVFLTIMLVYDL